MRQKLTIVLVLFLLAGPGGCANVAPVPGGTDSANQAAFKSVDELKARLQKLQPGMKEDAVFLLVGDPKENFSELDPEEIWQIGLGRGIFPAQAGKGDDRLTGYRLNYKFVTRRHGLSSPIRIQTNETGYSYRLTLLFRNGRLMDKPILSGGVVDNVESHTLLDYLTPGVALGHIR